MDGNSIFDDHNLTKAVKKKSYLKITSLLIQILGARSFDSLTFSP